MSKIAKVKFPEKEVTRENVAESGANMVETH
jgi:hypothetical protein